MDCVMENSAPVSKLIDGLEKDKKDEALPLALTSPSTSSGAGDETASSSRGSSRGPYVCNECDLHFPKQSRLHRHLASHSGERTYHCKHPGCTKSYTRSNHLTRHYISAHNEYDYRIRCTYTSCPTSFTTKQNLKKHIQRVHEGGYACSHCDQCFAKQKTLQCHLNSEHGDCGKHRCPQEGCTKAFDFPNKLKRHMKVHAMYACDVEGCGKQLQTWSLLRKHRAVEHPKIFQCSSCGRVFKRKKWLEDHEMTHSDTCILYHCPFYDCSRAYKKMYNLQHHIKSFHDNCLYSCTRYGCNKNFVTAQKLRQHENLHDVNRPLLKSKKNVKKRKDKGVPKLSMASVLSGYPLTRQEEIEQLVEYRDGNLRTEKRKPFVVNCVGNKSEDDVTVVPTHSDISTKVLSSEDNSFILGVEQNLGTYAEGILV